VHVPLSAIHAQHALYTVENVAFIIHKQNAFQADTAFAARILPS
jgi:hypothetical protein